MSATKISGKRTNILHCYFSKQFTLWHIRSSIFSSLEMQRTLIQIKAYCKLFYSVWKEASHKPLKVAAAKNSFLSDTFFVPWNDWKTLFFCTNLSLPRGLAQPPCAAFFQTSVLKEVRIIRHFHNNITILLIPKVQNKTSTS